MRTIDIDDVLYAYIARQTQDIGESAADILRRILCVPQTPGAGLVNSDHELAEALNGLGLKYRPAVDQFLSILAEAYKLKPDSFDNVLSIQGRERKYFANSRDEIESSGQSTQPKQIPGTNYWALTNSPTPQKRRLLRQALEQIGFSEQAAQSASQAML